MELEPNLKVSSYFKKYILYICHSWNENQSFFQPIWSYSVPLIKKVPVCSCFPTLGLVVGQLSVTTWQCFIDLLLIRFIDFPLEEGWNVSWQASHEAAAYFYPLWYTWQSFPTCSNPAGALRKHKYRIYGGVSRIPQDMSDTFWTNLRGCRLLLDKRVPRLCSLSPLCWPRSPLGGLFLLCSSPCVFISWWFPKVLWMDD